MITTPLFISLFKRPETPLDTGPTRLNHLFDAAAHAGVTDRQMLRWIIDLLDRHFGMVWGDLRLLEPDRRYNLASQIEKLEDIELRKQQTLNAIAAGKKSVEDEALERLLQKHRKRKDEPND